MEREEGPAREEGVQARLEKLRVGRCGVCPIRDLGIGPKKRELFTSLAEHLNVCASEVERAVAESPYHEITPDFLRECKLPRSHITKQR